MAKRRQRNGSAAGPLAQSLAYTLGKLTDVLVQNPVATGMAGLGINYALYKAGFWDPRPEVDPDRVVEEIIHHDEIRETDNQQHLIGYWLGTADPTYPLLWRWHVDPDSVVNPGHDGYWQWIGTKEEGQNQPWPYFDGTYEGQLAAVVNPIYINGKWTWVPDPKWPDYPDPGNGGVGVYCPVHHDNYLTLVTNKPEEPPTAPPEKAYAWEAAGGTHIVKEAWDETVKRTIPGGAHYYVYDFVPFDINLQGVTFFDVQKGREVSKVEGGTRIALFNSMAIIVGTVLWANAQKASYANGGGGEMALLGEMTKLLK